ncbi:MAG: M1 family metallopeptidase [Candidatus Aminicenantaceae bacterium]
MKPIKISMLSLFLVVGLVLHTVESLEAQLKISVIRYEIWVELDDQRKMLYGRENISWLNTTQDEVQDMWFHLFYNAFKNERSTLLQESREELLGALGIKIEDGEWGWIDVTSIKLADGRDLRPTAEFVTRDKPVHPDDQTVMCVEFPEPVKPGEEVHLLLEFKSKIPKGILRTGYYQDSYFIAQWFPKPGVYEEGKGWNCHEYHLNSEFYADFADFTVHITVPENFVVGASGKQVGELRDSDTNAVTYTFYQDNIHDFAWTADSDFIKVERDFIAEDEISRKEYEEAARKLQLPVENIKLKDMKMILLIEPEHRSQIERHFKALKMAVKYYGLWYGPYPYETITMVDPPFRTKSGGMEYPTFFTAGTAILRSKEVLSPEGVIIHEFGHGYWYGLCANNEFEEAWLDEGINSYSTGKVAGKAYGKGALPFTFRRMPLAWFLKLPKYYDDEFDRAVAIHVVELDPITTHSWKFYNRGSYALNVYMRASTCLHTLERLVGEDTMLRILRTFQMYFRYKHPRTEDFIQVVNEVSGQDLTWFFEELFFKTLNFDYGICSLTSSEKDKHVRGFFDINGEKEEFTQEKVEKIKAEEKKSGKREIYVTEVTVRRFGEAKLGGDVLMKLRVVFEDGSEEIVNWDGQKRWEKFTFKKPAKAKFAQIDPDKIWLIDSNLSNNSLKRKSSKGGIFRLTSGILFLIQNFLQCISSFS